MKTAKTTADARILFDIPDGGITAPRKLEAPRRACNPIGRPGREIGRSIQMGLCPDESVGDPVERCHAFGHVGLSYVVVLHPATRFPSDVVRLGHSTNPPLNMVDLPER